jgi:hypothetical protein
MTLVHGATPCLLPLQAYGGKARKGRAESKESGAEA